MTKIIDDLRKIETSTRKSRYITYLFILVFGGIIVSVWVGLYIRFKEFQEYSSGVNLYGNLSALFLLTGIGVWTIYYLASTEHLPKVIYPTDDGIMVNPKRIYVQKVSKDFKIRYDWIELIILNEMSHGDLWVDIFFTMNGKKYLYRDKQGRIKDIESFIRTLRERGTEVKVLEPSYKYQKKHDFGWIADIMRGREFV